MQHVKQHGATLRPRGETWAARTAEEGWRTLASLCYAEATQSHSQPPKLHFCSLRSSCYSKTPPEVQSLIPWSARGSFPGGVEARRASSPPFCPLPVPLAPPAKSAALQPPGARRAGEAGLPARHNTNQMMCAEQCQHAHPQERGAEWRGGKQAGLVFS